MTPLPSVRPLRLVLLATALLLGTAHPARAQEGAGGDAPPAPAKIVHVSVAPVQVAAGGSAEAKLELTITSPWHINANPPSPDYMIPTQATLPAASGITPGKAVYPAAHQLKVDFDDKPLAVYDKAATITLPLRAAADAASGAHVLKGTLRFQSCNDQVCLAPTSIPFQVAVTVTGGGAASTSAPSAAAPTAKPESAATAPAVDSSSTASRDTAALGATLPIRSVGGPSMSGNPLADAIGHGGLVAFLALFVLGLALNLTPCVYPMLGVTVSIFGARGAASTLQALGSALVYVLGMVVMYSALGVIAALTGGLFGAVLQSAAVQAGIGIIMLLMALSMFGAYEFQPPAWLLSRLGGTGTTNVLGLFASGVFVGVFAAPCVGPAVVALATVVGAKADVGFGLITFATLALGLGAPYIVLGTFTGLLHTLPRSGDWMVWVKKLFGVILVGIGAFYLCIAFAPRYASWVAPITWAFGGLYLGFIEKSGAKRPGFARLKYGVGVVGVAVAAWLLATAPKRSLEFQPYDAAQVKQALASGRPVILDFSADWCIPCHELERNTFSDARVIAAAHDFAAFQVDLTHADSPETQARVREFKIQGVPTVVFLAPDGREVEAARFSGFMPAGHFLERLKMASANRREG